MNLIYTLRRKDKYFFLLIRFSSKNFSIFYKKIPDACWTPGIMLCVIDELFHQNLG